MNLTKIRTFSLSALVAVVGAAHYAHVVNASLVSDNIPVSGTFGMTLNGSGTASITGASGSYWQSLSKNFPLWTKIGITGGPQTSTLSMSPVNAQNLPASGNIGLTYDNVSPGTPNSMNFFNVDLNGAGGNNTVVPFTINMSPMTFNISGLGNFNLALTINGQMTDFRFDSDNAQLPVPANPSYLTPGNYMATISGNVTGALVNVPLIGSVNLGTLTTIAPTTTSFAGGILGLTTLSDLQGGLPPFPNDMLANFFANINIVIPPFPLSTTFSVSQPNNTINTGQSGFKTLFINGGVVNAQLTLSNPNYNLNGTVPQVLVPEPSSFALAGLGFVGLVMGLMSRRRRTA